MLYLVSTALRRDGYEVLTAASGEEALAVMAQRGGPVDLLVTDINMPGITGVTLAESLLRDDGSLRTIFMTGQEPGEPLTATLGPMRRVLSKPFAPRGVSASSPPTAPMPSTRCATSCWADPAG